nr:MAG TPA: hypothetical protein [Bacteriophage sp.]
MIIIRYTINILKIKHKQDVNHNKKLYLQL